MACQSYVKVWALDVLRWSTWEVWCDRCAALEFWIHIIKEGRTQSVITLVLDFTHIYIILDFIISRLYVSFSRAHVLFILYIIRFVAPALYDDTIIIT